MTHISARFSTTQILESSLEGLEQIIQITSSLMPKHFSQKRIFDFSVRIALERSFDKSVFEFSTKKAIRCAVLRPIPGKRENSSIKSLRDSGNEFKSQTRYIHITKHSTSYGFHFFL